MPVQDDRSLQVWRFQATRMLAARPEAVPIARALVRDLSPDGRLELLTSELVTNAVVHGAVGEAESVLVWVGVRDDGTVMVEVWDEGATGVEPAVSEPEWHTVGGRGMLLVDALASRWGTRYEGARCVWFELASDGSGFGTAA
jgi:anti-sigma regulatory factor (Ser/Thr protein kinase)